MRETFPFDYHAQHAWLHALLRLLIVLLLLFVFAWLTEAAAQKQKRSHPLTKEQIIEAEQLLTDLGYWTGPVDGLFDNASQHALIAFQKIEGRKRTGRLTSEELEVLRSATQPEPRDSTYPHVEVDLRRQVLTMVDDSGRATNILPVCSGNEKLYTEDGRVQRAHTPRGTFKVVRKIAGWRRSKLGLLYYPNYIVNGIAIHGSQSVPPFPASHGCIRIPMFAAKQIAELMPVGTVVIVYDD